MYNFVSLYWFLLVFKLQNLILGRFNWRRLLLDLASLLARPLTPTWCTSRLWGLAKAFLLAPLGYGPCWAGSAVSLCWSRVPTQPYQWSTVQGQPSQLSCSIPKADTVGQNLIAGLQLWPLCALFCGWLKGHARHWSFQWSRLALQAFHSSFWHGTTRTIALS